MRFTASPSAPAANLRAAIKIFKVWDESWSAKERLGNSQWFNLAHVVDESHHGRVEVLVGGITDGSNANEGKAPAMSLIADDCILHVRGRGASLTSDARFFVRSGDESW